MKTLSLILLSVIALFSCKKESEVSSSNGRLSYKLNGQLIAYEDRNTRNQTIRISKLDPANFGESGYEMGAGRGQTDQLQMLLYTDSLKTINYRYDSAAALIHPLIVNISHYSPELISSRVVFAGDFLTVTITSHTNGKVSGNFSARLSPYSNSSSSYEYQNKGSVMITEGQFSDIIVSY